MAGSSKRPLGKLLMPNCGIIANQETAVAIQYISAALIRLGVRGYFKM